MFVPVILFIIGLCMSAVILPLSVGLYIYIERKLSEAYLRP